MHKALRLKAAGTEKCTNLPEFSVLPIPHYQLLTTEHSLATHAEQFSMYTITGYGFWVIFQHDRVTNTTK